MDPSWLELTQDDGELAEKFHGWDLAIRFHELKNRMSSAEKKRLARKAAAGEVLRRAQALMGSLVHPTKPGWGSIHEIPFSARKVEWDFEATFEEAQKSFKNLLPEEFVYSYETPKRQGVVLALDTSLSMTGEKLALTAVAVAVVALQFEQSAVGVVAFENEASIIKAPHERLGLQELVERFLDVPAKGYTHIENGLRAALKSLSALRRAGYARQEAAVILLTDGKYTAGRDPAFLADQFPWLGVMKMGPEKAGEALCKEMAHRGRGSYREVGDLHDLPMAMYSVVKELIRGGRGS